MTKEWLIKTVDERIEQLVYPERLNRVDRKGSVLLGSGLVGASMQFAYWFSRDIMGTLSYIYQRDIFKQDSNIYGVGFRHFFQNSFYLHQELALHEGIQIDYVNSVVGERQSKKSYDGGVNLSFGNLWQLKHFIVGIEAFGVYIPIFDNDADQDVQIRVAFAQLGFTW